jgi:hypothetical protein
VLRDTTRKSNYAKFPDSGVKTSSRSVEGFGSLASSLVSSKEFSVFLSTASLVCGFLPVVLHHQFTIDEFRLL